MGARIKGTKLTLTMGSTEISIDATSAVLDNVAGSADVTTFADALAGGTWDWSIAISGVQSTEVASFWRFLWANSGQIVPYVLRPHGNATPTPSEPHFTGTVKIDKKPPIGGAAGMASTFAFDTTLPCQEQPTLVDGATAVPVISAIIPNSSAALKVVRVTGTRLAGATAVTVKGVAAPFTVISDAEIAVYVPATAAGAAPVIVTTPGGNSVAVNLTIV
jgi:hypothetical protein